MKNRIAISFAVIASLFAGCSNGQTKSTNQALEAAEFSEKIKETPNAIIVDVRTPGEYAQGHLSGAVNIDWKGADFGKQMETLDKSKPVFVYCLSGGRSASAANKMRSEGFEQVYELKGGMMKWRAANLPETTNGSPVSEGMNRQQFEQLVNSDKLVLVDFYADWCAPCRKMEPYLEEISKDMADQVTVLRINADDNKKLMKELGVSSLPVLQLYRNQTVKWENKGYVDKETVVKTIQSTK